MNDIIALLFILVSLCSSNNCDDYVDSELSCDDNELFLSMCRGWNQTQTTTSSSSDIIAFQRVNHIPDDSQSLMDYIISHQQGNNINDDTDDIDHIITPSRSIITHDDNTDTFFYKWKDGTMQILNWNVESKQTKKGSSFTQLNKECHSFNANDQFIVSLTQQQQQDIHSPCVVDWFAKTSTHSSNETPWIKFGDTLLPEDDDFICKSVTILRKVTGRKEEDVFIISGNENEENVYLIDPFLLKPSPIPVSLTMNIYNGDDVVDDMKCHAMLFYVDDDYLIDDDQLYVRVCLLRKSISEQHHISIIIQYYSLTDSDDENTYEIYDSDGDYYYYNMDENDETSTQRTMTMRLIREEEVEVPSQTVHGVNLSRKLGKISQITNIQQEPKSGMIYIQCKRKIILLRRNNLSSPYRVIDVFAKSSSSRITNPSNGIIGSASLTTLLSDQDEEEYPYSILAIGYPHSVNSATSRGNIDIYVGNCITTMVHSLGNTTSNECDEYAFKKYFTLKDTDVHSNMGECVSWSSDSRYLITNFPFPLHPVDFQLGSYDLNLKERCKDCMGHLFGGVDVDECGICGGDKTSCFGCDDVRESTKQYDHCGRCDGNNEECIFIESIVVEDELQKDIYDVSIVVPTNNSLSSIHINHKLDRRPLCRNMTSHIFMNVLPMDSRTERVSHEEESKQNLCWKSSTHCSIKPNVSTISTSIDLPREKAVWHFRRRNPFYYDKNVPHLTDQSSGTPFPYTDIYIELLYDVIDCPGCDGIMASGMENDVCGVCNGNGSSCHDCQGILGGRSYFDECGECKSPSDKPSCFKVTTPPDLYIHCSEDDVTVHDYPPYHPYEDEIYEDDMTTSSTVGRSVKWKMVNRTHRFNAAHFNRLKGEFTYSNKKKLSIVDRICFQAQDQYNNRDINCFDVHVEHCGEKGCDGIINSGITIDQCGVCGGENQCIDCAGIIGGLHQWNENNSTCHLALQSSYEFFNEASQENYNLEEPTEEEEENNDGIEPNNTDVGQMIFALIIGVIIIGTLIAFAVIILLNFL